MQLKGTGESPYKVQTGDHDDVAGRMVEHAAAFAQRVGVSDPVAKTDAFTATGVSPRLLISLTGTLNRRRS